MFDFEKLEVYRKAKDLNRQVVDFISHHKGIDRITQDQLRRAAFSIMLNIAEGTGRFSDADRCNFFVIARGSVFECAAILDYLAEEDRTEEQFFLRLYHSAEEISKMLFSLIKMLKHPRKTV